MTMSMEGTGNRANPARTTRILRLSREFLQKTVWEIVESERR